MAPEQARLKYSEPQLTKYLNRLRIPAQNRVLDVSSMEPESALRYLALLQKHHLVEIPFENLSLNYSSHRQISLHPDELFKKIIEDDNSRGGYCMENNGLFGTLLYSLGFSVYSAGARVFEGGREWSGWAHMVNLVTIGTTKYQVDVGFGAESPIVPMPLNHSGTLQPHIKPAMSRVVYRNIVENTDPSQRLWVFEYRKNDNGPWEPKTCFTELEFLPQDYTIMNYFTSTNQRTFFTRVVLVERKILGDDGELTGSLILMGNNVKWKLHGEVEKDIELHSEADRLEALEKYFNIRFRMSERDGIHGLPSEIKSG